MAIIIIFFEDEKLNNMLIRNVIDLEIVPYTKKLNNIEFSSGIKDIKIFTKDVDYHFHTGIKNIIHLANEKDLFYINGEAVGYKKIVYFHEELEAIENERRNTNE